jgi:heme/copper-type cytochrome/quinol oxidase subunit 3
MPIPFLFDIAETTEGMDVRIAEAANPEAALPKKDLLFMIIVLICECMNFCSLLEAYGVLFS